jgi:hypothetical protein
MEMDNLMTNIYIQERRSRRRGQPLTKFIVALIAMASIVSGGTEPSAYDQKSAPAPVLVELFTSEGCSSCPPADKLLAQMESYQAADVGPLVVLSEHVDYWDHDGWKDAYSESSLTDRQNQYAQSLGLSTVYTPQLIVDGATELKLSDPGQVKGALLKASSLPKIPVTIGPIRIDAGEPAVIRAEIEVDGSTEQHNSDVYVAVALNHAETQVLHGENAGRVLTHVAVVQQLTKLGKLEKRSKFSQEFQAKLKPGTDPKNIRLIAFAQSSGGGKVIGVALRKTVP